MIVVRVELHSVITGHRTELARMHISNTGEGTQSVRHYDGQTLKGRSTAQLDRRVPQRHGTVRNWRSLDLHVWNLVATMLTHMGYGAPNPASAAEASTNPTYRTQQETAK